MDFTRRQKPCVTYDGPNLLEFTDIDSLQCVRVLLCDLYMVNLYQLKPTAIVKFAFLLSSPAQGLFHPARKVREVYWKIYNMLYIGSQVTHQQNSLYAVVVLWYAIKLRPGIKQKRFGSRACGMEYDPVSLCAMSKVATLCPGMSWTSSHTCMVINILSPKGT